MSALNETPSEPTTVALLKDLHHHLYTLVRELSKKRFSDFTSRTEIEVSDAATPDDFIYGSHLSLIQLAAKDLRLTFKTHFNLKDVSVLTERKTTGQRTSEQVRKASYDLFKEYSNLVAGGIAQQLHGCGIVAGISLPIATSGFSEIISSDVLKQNSYNDYWRIFGKDFAFTCSSFVEIFETDALDRFVYSGEDQESGNIEIL